MLRFLYIFIFLVTLLNANDKVEIFAASMDSKKNIVKASGDVVVVYKDYQISAKRAIYNRDSGELELFENIRASQGTKLQLLGDYAKLNIQKKEKSFKPFFMLDKKSQAWISADEGCAVDKDFDIDSGVMSGCDPTNPLWTMEFTSSSYNSDSKWLNLYNTVIYIYDIPVFYTPYFGYSLDTRRRTGLLVPSVGLSNKEGFYYSQSFYIAEQNWWDLELRPQYRANRGYGGYATFRFTDSAVSRGELTVGHFKEKQNYFLANDLAHDSHYGYNFTYDNSDFINQWFSSKLEGQSGLYIDINGMNDVDYINLASNDTINTSTSTQVLSRINMFYNTDENYYGAYFKYYQDLTKESNENTLQKLPTFQYHNYLSTLLDNHLFYNIDVQSTNIQRDINKKVVQTDVNIPITLQTSLFDEYLNVAYKGSLYAQHSSFSGSEVVPTNTEYKDGVLARNYNKISLSTELTKAYDEYTHVINFGSSYTFAGGETKSGFYDYNKDFCSDKHNARKARCEFYNISPINDVAQFDFSQYIYDASGKQIVYHRLSQAVTFYELETKIGELENELSYQVTDNINYYNDMFYSFENKAFSKVVNQFSYKVDNFNLSLSHLYKDSFIAPTLTRPRYTSYLTSGVKYNYNEHYSYFMNYDYDIQSSVKKRAEIGFLYKKRCWDFGIRYVENNRPVLTSSGNVDNSVYDKYIFFTIVLKPIMSTGSGSSEYAFTLPDSF